MMQLVEPSIHSMISGTELVSKVNNSPYVIPNAMMKVTPDKVMLGMKQNVTKPLWFPKTSPTSSLETHLRKTPTKIKVCLCF